MHVEEGYLRICRKLHSCVLDGAVCFVYQDLQSKYIALPAHIPMHYSYLELRILSLSSALRLKYRSSLFVELSL